MEIRHEMIRHKRQIKVYWDVRSNDRPDWDPITGPLNLQLGALPAKLSGAGI